MARGCGSGHKAKSEPILRSEPDGSTNRRLSFEERRIPYCIQHYSPCGNLATFVIIKRTLIRTNR